VIQGLVQDELGLPELPKSIECCLNIQFQARETVGPWGSGTNGARRRATIANSSLAKGEGRRRLRFMREVMVRRYARYTKEKSKRLPS